jgi:hypothetical protein
MEREKLISRKPQRTQKTLSTSGKLYDRLNSFGIAKMHGVEQARFPDVRVALSELDEPIWAVISFEGVEALDLVYEEATRLLSDLEDRGIPGLCIVTNAAAARFKTQE